MRYSNHLQNPPGLQQPSFTITVDDETMTWVSDPPGDDITKPLTTYFSCGGPPGSGKRFQVFPGGRARLVK